MAGLEQGREQTPAIREAGEDDSGHSHALHGASKLCKVLNFNFNNPFAYFTQICWSCAMTYLKKYYDELNFKRQLVKEHMERAQEEMPSINIDKSYMDFLKTMIGSEQITEDDAKFLKRQKDSIIQEIRDEQRRGRSSIDEED